MTDVPVVVCRSCDGVTFTLAACRCTHGGDRLLVGADDHDGTPYQECLLCQGVGTVAHPCRSCGQTGRRRAQLVLTVANLDTGAVASANVVPGVLEPRPWPAGAGWHLPVAPLVRELAAVVGAGSWREVRSPHRSTDGPVIFLPRQWRPELPEPTRRALEAEAIAHQGAEPWQVLLGRTALEPPRDPGDELGRLCQLADLLCLDLVVEARRRGPTGAGELSWDIRYELPGAPVPSDTHGWADDLPAAIATTTVADAMYGLAERCRTAPAHYLRAGQRPVADPPPIDVDQVEQRVIADGTDLRTGAATAGAQAIWRDGRWWHTTLRVAGRSESLHERATGQVASRKRWILRRTWQPPTPSWQGAPTPYLPCPDCQPGSRLRTCDCVLVRGRADTDCPDCAGSGRSPSALPCHTCWDSHRVYQGVSVTVTDLRGSPVHLTWRVGDPTTAPLVATEPGGKPVHQLPARFRFARWADDFGVRPEDLAHLDGGGFLDQALRDGVVTLDHPGQDPLTRHLARVSRGRPGARLLVLAAPPDVPPLADLIRLVLGLHLAVTVTMREHGRNHGDPRLVQGESWDVTVDRPGRPVTPADPPTQRTPEAAVQFCLNYLELATAAAVPADPDEPIPIPQTPRPFAVDDDPVSLIRQLGRHHPGQSAAVHYDRTGVQLHLSERSDTRHLATAPTLSAALTALGLRP